MAIVIGRMKYTAPRSGAVSKITTPEGRNQTSCCNQRLSQASWGCITDCHLGPFYMKD